MQKKRKSFNKRAYGVHLKLYCRFKYFQSQKVTFCLSLKIKIEAVQTVDNKYDTN